MPKLMIEKHQMTALMALIVWIEGSPPFSQLELQELQVAQKKSIRAAMKNHEELRKVMEYGQSPVVNFFNEIGGKAGYNAAKDDLFVMVNITTDLLLHQNRVGEYVPPGYARRIGIILGKVGMPALRERFDQAYARHDPWGLPWPPARAKKLSRLGPTKDPSVSICVSSATRVGDSAKYNLEFSMECQDCGGFVMHVPDEHVDESPATCKACGANWGTFASVNSMAQQVGREWLLANVVNKANTE